MEPVELSAFKGGFWQDLTQFLLLIERSGCDVRYIRQQVHSWKEQQLREQFRNRKKPDETPTLKPKFKRQEKEVTIKQSHIPCPECQKGYLQVKKLDDVTYTACPQCYKSVEFK